MRWKWFTLWGQADCPEGIQWAREVECYDCKYHNPDRRNRCLHRTVNDEPLRVCGLLNPITLPIDIELVEL